MAPSRPTTRKKCINNWTSFIGKGKDFLPSEVPTLRAVIYKGLLLQKEKIAITFQETYIHYQIY